MKRLISIISILFVSLLSINLFQINYLENNKIENISVTDDYLSSSADINDIIIINNKNYTITEKIYSNSGYYKFYNCLDENNSLVFVEDIGELNNPTYHIRLYYDDYNEYPWTIRKESNKYLENNPKLCYRTGQIGNIYSLTFYYYIDCDNLYNVSSFTNETNNIHEKEYFVVPTTSNAGADNIFLIDSYENNNSYTKQFVITEENNISNDFYFSNLNQNIGNNINGSCAFVSFQMMLNYYDSMFNDNFINENYDIASISTQKRAELFEESPGSTEQFHQYLINLFKTYKDLNEIRYALNYNEVNDLYLAYKNTFTHNNPFNNFQTKAEAFSRTDIPGMNTMGTKNDLEQSAIDKINDGHPLILMMNSWNVYDYQINSNNNMNINLTLESQNYNLGHAVVAYGYYILDNEVYFRVNMGWKNTNNADKLVKMNSTGGLFTFYKNNQSKTFENISNYKINDYGEIVDINFDLVDDESKHLTEDYNYVKYLADNCDKTSNLYKINIVTNNDLKLYINGVLVINYTSQNGTKIFDINLEKMNYANIVLEILGTSKNAYLNIDDGGRTVLEVTPSLMDFEVYNTLSNEFFTNQLSVIYFNPVIDEQNKEIT